MTLIYGLKMLFFGGNLLFKSFFYILIYYSSLRSDCNSWKLTITRDFAKIIWISNHSEVKIVCIILCSFMQDCAEFYLIYTCTISRMSFLGFCLGLSKVYTVEQWTICFKFRLVLPSQLLWSKTESQLLGGKGLY